MAQKQGLAARVQASDELSLAGHMGIADYQPEELEMVARGTLLAEIEEVLAQKGQMLAFEPPHLEGFYGTEHAGSLGGVIACNLSGPRRISAGAARDYLLGFDAVSGRAGYFRSGSKAMKNVTGYDLSKLMCGSFGMLAVYDEITLKVLPRPEYVASLSLNKEALPKPNLLCLLLLDRQSNRPAGQFWPRLGICGYYPPGGGKDIGRGQAKEPV